MSKYHVMPNLSDEEYQELKDSIATHGVLQPILVDHNGDIIDGHHRKRACDELGIPCPKRDTLSDLKPNAVFQSEAYTLNLARRHLTAEKKRGLLAQSIKSDPELSDREHGRRTGTDHKTAAKARGRLESSGDIPQSEKRAGADGRKRTSRPKRKPTPKADDTGSTPTPDDGDYTKQIRDVTAALTSAANILGKLKGKPEFQPGKPAFEKVRLAFLDVNRVRPVDPKAKPAGAQPDLQVVPTEAEAAAAG